MLMTINEGKCLLARNVKKKHENIRVSGTKFIIFLCNNALNVKSVRLRFLLVSIMNNAYMHNIPLIVFMCPPKMSQRCKYLFIFCFY